MKLFWIFLYSRYGAGFRSLNTGIVYNNQMDDFSTNGQSTRFGYPPSKANYIKPKKRPVSSMVPVIMTDKEGDVKLVIGGSGGPKIITAVAQVTESNYVLDLIYIFRQVNTFRKV